MKSCCLSGLRYKDFPFDTEKNLTATERYREALRDKLIHVINEYGITHFVTGLASEADIDFAETVLSLRDDESFDVSLECIVLGATQFKNLSEDGIFRHNAVLIRADKQMKLSSRYILRRRYKRDITMLTKCELLLSVVCGTRSTDIVRYARKLNISVDAIDISE